MTTVMIETTRDRLRPDAELARAAGTGDAAAFEALYDRHHRALLSFARHMVGRVHDAEDVVQHTFLAADAEFRGGRVPASVRAWLYTVARNRCVSILRARRDDRALPDLDLPSSENLADEVEQRDELRALLADLRMLPDEQRAALLLAELGELSHAEVAQVLSVRPRKVKALVYQARQALLAAAGARAIPCRSIRDELAAATGAARRRRHLREHVARCEGCRAYADGVARQRASLAVLLPVVPTVALRDAVLDCLGSGASAAAGASGAATAGGAAAGASGAATSVGSAAAGASGVAAAGTSGVAAAGAGIGAAGAKLLAIAAIGGAAAGGGAIAVTAPDAPDRKPPAARAAQVAPARVAPAAPVARVPARELHAAAPAGARPEAAREPSRRRAARSERPAAKERRRDERAGPPGLALGHDRQEAREQRPPKAKPVDAAPGRSATPPTKPAKPVQAQPEPPAAQPERQKPAPAGQAQAVEPPAAVTLPGEAMKPDVPPGQLKQD